MTARRIASGLALLFGATLVAAACGSTAPTTAPTSGATQAAPTLALPSLGLPGSFALPSLSADPELEAMFPTEIGGSAVTVRSVTGETFMAFPGSSTSMGPALQLLGKTPADLTVATGGTADGSVILFAFRIEGVDASQSLAAFTGPTASATVSDTTFGGKSVKKVVTAGQTVYLYAKGDVLWTVGGPGPSDAVLAETFSKLP